MAIGTALALGTLGASLIGGLSANKANRKEASRNRAFQERMRNTQWQAAVADMEAAGLNPALAYSQGPNAAPGGSMARQDDVVTPALSSAMQNKMQQEQFKLMKQQRILAEDQAIKIRQESKTAQYEADMNMERLRYYVDQNGRPTRAFAKLLEQEHAGRMAASARQVQDLRLQTLREPELKAMAELFGKAGAGGKGAQIALPILLRMFGR